MPKAVRVLTESEKTEMVDVSWMEMPKALVLTGFGVDGRALVLTEGKVTVLSSEHGKPESV